MDDLEDIRVVKARKRIKDIKGFYSHLTVYILVNIFILAASTDLFTDFDSNHEYGFWKFLSTPVFWGIGLLIHGLAVFVPSFGFVKRWEDRKMKELMDNDKDYKYKR